VLQRRYATVEVGRSSKTEGLEMRAPRKVKWTVAAAVVTIGLASPLLVGASSGSTAPPKVVRLEDSRIKFEINATDGDGGLQFFVDGESWKRMTIYGPGGGALLTTTASGLLRRQGGTELFLESGEPTFDELPLAQLLRRWPEGRYRFRGEGVGGELFVGSALLTHDIPNGPHLVSPIEGAPRQDPRHTVIRWRSVPPPHGSPIIGYEVIVERETGVKELPVTTLDVMMAPSATRLAVPPGFLRHGKEYDYEVLAIESGGNQTLSSSSFTTS
jgi:hypothetical protein